MIYDEKRNSCQASVFAALFMIYVGYLTKKGSRKWQDGVKKFMEKWEVYKIYVLLGIHINSGSSGMVRHDSSSTDGGLFGKWAGGSVWGCDGAKV